jgi:hypothetical protein
MDPWEFPLSRHLREDHPERQLPEDWIRRTVRFPDRKPRRKGDTVHYVKAFRQYGGLYLRVVVNMGRQLIVTAFFDSDLGRRRYPRRTR